MDLSANLAASENLSDIVQPTIIHIVFLSVIHAGYTLHLDIIHLFPLTFRDWIRIDFQLFLNKKMFKYIINIALKNWYLCDTSIDSFIDFRLFYIRLLLKIKI